MTDEQKKPYVEEMKDLFKEYQLKMSAWEREMIKLGNLDIIRQEALIEPKPTKVKKTKKIQEQGFGCPDLESSNLKSVESRDGGTGDHSNEKEVPHKREEIETKNIIGKLRNMFKFKY